MHCLFCVAVLLKNKKLMPNNAYIHSTVRSQQFKNKQNCISIYVGLLKIKQCSDVAMKIQFRNSLHEYKKKILKLVSSYFTHAFQWC